MGTELLEANTSTDTLAQFADIFHNIGNQLERASNLVKQVPILHQFLGNSISLPAIASPQIAKPAISSSKEEETEDEEDNSPVAAAPRRGRPPAASKGKEKEKEGGKVSLKRAIWMVLDRPENGDGLKTSEIIEQIVADKLWTTKSDSMAQMVQGAVGALRSDKKLVRNPETKKYYIPEGATF
jgi:hypothetical protein